MEIRCQGNKHEEYTDDKEEEKVRKVIKVMNRCFRNVEYTERKVKVKKVKNAEEKIR